MYTTTVYTVTSCGSTVTNCPAHLGSITTETIALYTTVCPVTAIEATPTLARLSSAPTATGALRTISTTTISSTATNYVTVKVVKSTATLVPYPTGSGSEKTKGLFGTGVPSLSLVIKPEASSLAVGVQTSPIASAIPSSTQFTGAASSVRGMGGIMIVVALGAMALLI